MFYYGSFGRKMQGISVYKKAEKENAYLGRIYKEQGHRCNAEGTNGPDEPSFLSRRVANCCGVWYNKLNFGEET
jgi:hypothetical protein